MHILVTNDDGVSAPGLLALAEEMSKLGKVTILAPDHNWSTSGHVKNLDLSLQLKEVQLNDKFTAWVSDGAPSDCVALAACGFIKEKIDLVVSGINPYANLSHDVTYSGTVTAAMEATIWGYPAIAISLDSPENLVGPVDYRATAQVARVVAQSVLRYGLPPGVLLNVNVPFLPYEQLKGIRISRQGQRVYHDRLDDDKANNWIPGDARITLPDRGTDVNAIAEGVVSVTPIQLDLTAYHAIPDLNSWEWDTSDQPHLIVEMPTNKIKAS